MTTQYLTNKNTNINAKKIYIFKTMKNPIRNKQQYFNSNTKKCDASKVKYFFFFLTKKNAKKFNHKTHIITYI